MRGSVDWSQKLYSNRKGRRNHSSKPVDELVRIDNKKQELKERKILERKKARKLKRKKH